jgi:hypothetical protein
MNPVENINSKLVYASKVGIAMLDGNAKIMARLLGECWEEVFRGAALQP